MDLGDIHRIREVDKSDLGTRLAGLGGYFPEEVQALGLWYYALWIAYYLAFCINRTQVTRKCCRQCARRRSKGGW